MNANPLLCAAACLAAVALGAGLVEACATRPPPTPEQIVFAAELRACVDTASSREESRACRAEVERRYAPIIEAGAR